MFGHPVMFGYQQNIIVWDPDTLTEHFIRSATFFADGKDLGFIAPTPSKPELSDADPKAFDCLASLKPIPKKSESSAPVVGGVAPKPAVQVVQEQDVSGFHATTLLASDAKALAAWMNANGYQTSPAVEQWTGLYIGRGWYLTAFKVLTKGGEAVTTKPVRMSFKTAQPFNPYYVPSDNIDPHHHGALKVFFVAPGAYEGHLGEDGAWQDPEWSAAVPATTADELGADLKLQPGEMPSDLSVESFSDPSFPRLVTDDIYFTPLPTPPIAYVFSVVILAGAVFVLGWMVRSLIRTTKKQAA